MTSSQHGLYVLGDTGATMGGTMGSQPARGSESHKAALSSDRRLQLACVKPESLVTAGQPHGGEYVLGACTHRPSSHGSRGHSKSCARKGHAEGALGDWG
jgi:hypothetical protein